MLDEVGEVLLGDTGSNDTYGLRLGRHLGPERLDVGEVDGLVGRGKDRVAEALAERNSVEGLEGLDLRRLRGVLGLEEGSVDRLLVELVLDEFRAEGGREELEGGLPRERTG